MMISGSAGHERGKDNSAAEVPVIELAMRPGIKPGTFTVEVVRSEAGEADAVVNLAVEDLLARRVPPGPQAEEPIRAVGEALFTALLGTGDVAGIYRANAALAAERDQTLRVVLRIGSPELADLPWEAMYDKTTGTYLCMQAQLIRRVPVPVATAPLEVSPPLRILGVISAPRGMEALDVEKERDLFESALAEPIADGLVEIVWAQAATWDCLHNLLLAGPWHVLHFIGHGSFDPDADEGVLALTGASGYPDLVEARRFTGLLRQAKPTPRLVVLNCCSSATSGTSNLFAGTAYALARAGIPAVAAMQFRITDRAASAFARGFYSAIARRRSIDDAVSAGRTTILGMRRSTMEWVTPVLFLHGDRAQLFTGPSPSGPGSAAPVRSGQGLGASGAAPAGQVFICYDGQDSVQADRLQNLLEMAGLQVWRDTASLWPGQDWRMQIRKAITTSTLIFLACFSRAGLAQVKSRQNEEVVLAIDELRRRNPEIPWLVPVRFDDCQIPVWDLGGGRTLGSLEPTDLFGAHEQMNGQRLVEAIKRLLGA